MEYKNPNHIAIIMDGNGRWAQKRGLKRTKGHQKGADALKKISEYVYDKNIKFLFNIMAIIIPMQYAPIPIYVNILFLFFNNSKA